MPITVDDITMITYYNISKLPIIYVCVRRLLLITDKLVVINSNA